jgi:hypothetical protein
MLESTALYVPSLTVAMGFDCSCLTTNAIKPLFSPVFVLTIDLSLKINVSWLMFKYLVEIIEDIKMEEVEITIKRVIQIWWAWQWRLLVFLFLFGLILSVILGVILGVTGHKDASSVVGALVGLAIVFPISIWTFKTALHKKYSGYSIALIKRSES